ncbi:HAD-IA family hydrolase [Microlunatus speluncae]|uniref:HAD-IA family hydrolase n=1 Tax=Microlunatus speluncae TaxID=2594267 RepID=UPI0012662C4C|nr:HAD-IA family hydrolase [Microlunatus speluncae]
MNAAGYDTVVFDLGAVVLGWDPVPAFATVLPAAEVPPFLEQIGFSTWNHTQDAGRPFDDGEAELIEKFGDQHAAAIRAYRSNFELTLTGMIPGTGAVIAELQRAGIRLVALTNWSHETFPHAQRRFGLLRRFSDILVSGAERMVKPDPAIFRLLIERNGLDPARAIFVDDVERNVTGAEAVGLTGIQFTDADALRARLVELGLLGPREPVTEPVFHLTDVETWRAAMDAGGYLWSTRDVGYDLQGYVHLSFAGQLPALRQRLYPDRADAELILLELRPEPADPLVVEDLDAEEPYPHLYAPLPVDRVQAKPLS